MMYHRSMYRDFCGREQPMLYNTSQSSFHCFVGNELYTNLGLAFVAVFLVTLLLVANLWVCLLVCLSVIVTLVSIFYSTSNRLLATYKVL